MLKAVKFFEGLIKLTVVSAIEAVLILTTVVAVGTVAAVIVWALKLGWGIIF